MPRIPQDIIDRVIQENDIVEIISESVPLKKAGQNYKGLCPFHGEKTPSFTVSVTKQIYHCFGCGAGGNVLGFVMAKEKLPFPEAVEKLAARRQIEIPRTAADKTQQDANEIFFRLNHYANWYFRNALKSNPVALDYLRQRGLTAEKIEAFEIGFAPPGFDGLQNFFTEKGVPLERALQLGLLRKSEKGSVYDFFRNRIMFPIYSASGKIIAFGGRTLDSNEPAKYVNSPESPIYHKSQNLYGYWQAKKTIFSESRVFVVEGYMDVLASVAMGLIPTVAPLGTSLTKEQVALLARSHPTLFLMFDGDEAGRKALLRAIDLCLEKGLHPRVVRLAVKDPGEYLPDPTRHQEFLDCAEKAPYALDWLLSETLKNPERESPAVARRVGYLLDRLQRIPDELERRHFYDRIRGYFPWIPPFGKKGVEKTQGFVSPPELQRKKNLDESLIRIGLKSWQNVVPDDWEFLAKSVESPELRALADFFCDCRKNQETLTVASAIQQLPLELQSVLARVEMQLEDESEASWQELIDYKKEKIHKGRLQKLTAELAEAEARGDGKTKLHLLKMKQELLRKD